MGFAEIFQNIIGNKYLAGIAIFLGFYVLAELLKFVVEKFLVKAAKKTKTELDDVLIQKTKRPFSFLLMIVGIKLAFLHISLANKTGDIIAKIVNSIIAVLVIYVIISIVKIILSYWGETFAKKTKSEVDEHLVAILKKAMTVIFFIAIVLSILQVWGIEIGPLLAGLGIGGIAIAFALQKSLGNIFGGISLILDRSIAVGDVVKLDDGTTKGEIVDIGLRSTKIKSFNNEYIIVPNGKLEEMNIQNVVKPEPSIRVVIPFSVAYGTKIERVKKIVLKEIAKIDGLDTSKDRDPVVRFLLMADSALNFKVYFYIKSYENKYGAIDQSTTMIYDALNKAKISIPFPQMDVWMKK